MHGGDCEVDEASSEPDEVEEAAYPMPPRVPFDKHRGLRDDVGEEAEEEDAVEGQRRKEKEGRDALIATALISLP